MNESKLKGFVIVRMIIVAVLTLLLLIPTIFVHILVEERQHTRDAAIAEISKSWGGNQTLAGPILTLPYKDVVENVQGNSISTMRYIHILPSKLMIHTTLAPEIRYRGIYEVGLYNARVAINGEFPALEFGKLGVTPEQIQWNNAFVTFGISDLKGIRDTLNFKLQEQSFASEPGVLSTDVVESGISFKIPMTDLSSTRSFSFNLNLNGSTELRFIPVGEVTQLTMDSPWNTPSFVGTFLPDTREITSKAFHAEWKVLNLNRNFPQVWVNQKYKLEESSFGVRLFLPVDEYQKTERTVKYAILFIALTFVAFFLSEVMTKVALHPIQYALIGLALIVFYVLLLSLSEHIMFNNAYAISSVAVIALITVYSRWITSSTKISGVIATVLVVLYSFLFVTLQLEDYALLIGSVGLFLVLMFIMYLTRNIDWFTMNKVTKGDQPGTNA